MENEKKVMLSEKEYTELTEELAELREQNAWLKKQVFGQKSEKTEVIMEKAEQIGMFNEAEVESNPNAIREITVPEHKRKSKRTHDELMEKLPIEEVLHEVESKVCDKCGSEMEVIGKEKIRDELVRISSQLFVRRHMAEVVRCTTCGKDETKDNKLTEIESQNIRKAKVPEPFIPHSFCSPELLAHIIHDKYILSIPLNRQEKEYASKGAIISRTTMANWIIYASEKYFRPIYTKMKQILFESDVIHADETVVQVLNEPGKKAKTDSRMWCYTNGKQSENTVVLFEYAPTRSGDNAARFLGNYSGYLVCDGYDGYNKVIGAKRCGCYAHARRKFTDALPTDPNLATTSAAAKGIEYCNRLFSLENQYENLTSEERQKKRQEESKPLLDEFFAWAETIELSGKTGLSKAVQYLKNEKRYLYTFLEDGNVPISNNRAENAIRPFCVGRKNWLFSASVKGAEASAMIYSVITTAKENGLNTEEYLSKMFTSNELNMPW